MDIFLEQIHQELGITSNHLLENKLSFQSQPDLSQLVVVDIDFEGKPFVLESNAAKAWKLMSTTAEKDEVYLRPFSGFRSYLHQKRLIEQHLKNGRIIEKILTHIAIPGFSEHHTGKAIDIYAAGNPVLEENFEKSNEFDWLKSNALRFGFKLSYPKQNDMGIIYEPWHWYYDPN